MGVGGVKPKEWSRNGKGKIEREMIGVPSFLEQK